MTPLEVLTWIGVAFVGAFAALVIGVFIAAIVVAIKREDED